MTVSERIRLRRLELGLTVDEVAEKLNKNRATIYRYENEDISKLPASILEPLAKVLNTTPHYLMGWENPIKNLMVNEPDLQPEAVEIAKLYLQLDDLDRAEIRGEIKGMLRADKYKKNAEETA